MPNERLQRLMKEKNISVLKLAPNKTTPDPIMLTGINDPRLPRQISKELKKETDIIEIVYLPPSNPNQAGQYRVTLKWSDDFNACIFNTITKL